MTTWTDSEILNSIKLKHMLPPGARARALELAETRPDLLDANGQWRLTPAGEAFVKANPVRF